MDGNTLLLGFVVWLVSGRLQPGWVLRAGPEWKRFPVCNQLREELASLCNDLILHLHQTIFWWCWFCHPSSLEQTPWTAWERTAGVGVEATAHKSVKSLFSTCCVLIFRVCYRLQKLGWSFGQESFAIIQILTGESSLGVSSGKGISDFIIVSNCSEETCPQRYAFLYISFRIKREKLLFLEPCR